VAALFWDELSMADEPDNLVLEILRGTRGDIQELRGDIQELRGGMQGMRVDIHEMRGGMQEMRGDIQKLDAKVDLTRRDLSDQIVGLRRAVIDYHTSTIGHGVLISELEARLRRVETHLGLEPAGQH
jgi:hypothetical protein